ncbi:MAG: MarR family transcriptional regulator [Chloroflexi bacterium]|nr:MarR family transcriptional regulator [Chloroflexota bacterium]
MNQIPIGQLLLQGFRWFDASLLKSLKARGWPEQTRPQSMLFANLDIESGTRSSELARRIGVSRQAVHQTVRELEALNLVQLAPDPSNQSAKLVQLTDRGLKIVEDAIRVFTAIEKQLGDRIGEDNIVLLRQVLEEDWGSPIGGD